MSADLIERMRKLSESLGSLSDRLNTPDIEPELVARMEAALSTDLQAEIERRQREGVDADFLGILIEITEELERALQRAAKREAN